MPTSAKSCRKDSVEDFSKEPIENIQWLRAKSLSSNTYNPNVVFDDELKLLEHSILTNGWLQPILANPDGIIIDGFHRWRLSMESKKIAERYDGRLPVVTLDLSIPDAMMLTIRINRAKGTHIAFKMSDIVKVLVDEHDLSPGEIATGIGATKDEMDLLYAGDVFKRKGIKNYRYSSAWYPIEDKNK